MDLFLCQITNKGEIFIKDFIFKNSEFGELNLLMLEDKVYFPATQCAKIVGHENPTRAIRKFCKRATKMVTPTAGGTQEVNYIPEGDLYRLIVRSKLPAAEKFEHWIFDEVLPTICKTGGYVNNDDLFINTYLSYADENTKNLFRLQLITITQLNKKIEQDKPLVDFATQVSNTDDLIDIGALSKLLQKQGLDIGRNKLFKWLKDNKFIRLNNEPYQKYINEGYFQTKETTYLIDEHPKIAIKTYVTGKGQQYLFNKLSKENIE